MKKLLILAGVIGLMTTTQCFAQDENAAAPQPPQAPCEKQFKPENCNLKKLHKGPNFEEFEQKLKLTDEQKAKAKALREAEHEQIRPFLDKIGEKMNEEKAVMDKKLTFDERQAELAPIRKDIHEIKNEIRTIRMQNKAKFESLLTSKQLKKLEKMKEDGMKNAKPQGQCNCGMKRPPMPPCPERMQRPEIMPAD